MLGVWSTLGGADGVDILKCIYNLALLFHKQWGEIKVALPSAWCFRKYRLQKVLSESYVQKTSDYFTHTHNEESKGDQQR